MVVFSGLDSQRGAFHRACSAPGHGLRSGGGTVMRYAEVPRFPPLPKSLLPIRPRPASTRGLAIPSTGLAQALPPGRRRALLPAITLSPVAAPADHGRSSTKSAVEAAVALRSRVVLHIQATRTGRRSRSHRYLTRIPAHGFGGFQGASRPKREHPATRFYLAAGSFYQGTPPPVESSGARGEPEPPGSLSGG